LERKLTAILCADVFGYSRLMGENEEATLRTLSSHRKLIDSLIEQHHGRFVNSAGDSVLAEFASVVNAVQCAVEIQSTLKAENANLLPERRMEFRIGINLGDVMVDGEQIYGDGVNVAARLESLADPGSILISGSVHEQLGNKLVLGYQDLGEQSVKNIAKPVRVFRVMLEGGAATRTTSMATERSLRKHWRGGVFSLAGLALIAAVIVFVQHLSLRPPTTTASIPPAQPPALALPDKPSIAVLPFTNMSGDRDQEYFSDGITEDLITALSRLPSLFVIARTSSFAYKGKAEKVQDIARELGVAYVLEGGVRKSGNSVRITAQLVDAATGDHMWAQHYDRPLKDIFSLQDEIVGKIVTTLNLQLSLWETYGLLVTRRTDNLEAYDYFLRGLEYTWSSFTKAENEKARRMYEKAVNLDPNYSDAFASLGFTYFEDWGWRWSLDAHDLDRASELEQQAVGLDDSQPLPHALLGAIYLYKRQHDQALAEGQRAIGLDPNFAPAYLWMAETLTFSGKPAEAVVLAEKAMRLDPRNRDSYLYEICRAYNRMGRYAEAVPICKRYLAHYPNGLDSLAAHVSLVNAYVELGRGADARAEWLEVLRISPSASIEDFMKKSPDIDRALIDRRVADLRKAGLK
jgi:adenylate cyclase